MFEIFLLSDPTFPSLRKPTFLSGIWQPRPQGFSLKKWVFFFKGKTLGTRLWNMVDEELLRGCLIS